MQRAPTIKAALSCFALLSLAQASPGNAGPLAITGDDSQGGGYGFRIGQQCVILTAAHVVEGKGDMVVADDRARVTIRAGEWTPHSDLDIAYATVAAGGIPSCVETFIDPTWTRGFDYRANSQALLLHRTSPTALRQVPLRVSESHTSGFTFSEQRKGTVATGYSGSMVLMNNRPMAIATRLDAGRGEVHATSLLTALQLWPAIFQPDGLRTRIALLPVMFGRTRRDDWNLLAVKALQDKPNVQLTYGADAQRACAVGLTVTKLDRTYRANPEYTNHRKNCANASKNVLMRLVCPAQPPLRYLYDYSVAYTVQTMKPGGAMRVSTPSFAFTIKADSSPGRELENQVFEASVSPSVDRALQEGGCR